MSSTKMFGSNNAEMSRKLRAAIKAKLEELGVYVDEELPDYIMVMIANRKEKSQMKEDLLLFLGKSTNRFVEWLFEIFERLQSAGASSLSDSSSSQQGRKKEQSSLAKKENVKDLETEKRLTKKERENDNKRTELKEAGKRKEKEKSGEKERREARVVKSKPSFHHRVTSRSPSQGKIHSKKKIDAKVEGKDKDKKLVTVVDESPGKEVRSRVSERDLSDLLDAKKHSAEDVSQKHAEEKDDRSFSPCPQQREKKSHVIEHGISPRHSAKRKKNPSAIRMVDSDEEERLAEEESRQELYGKKVLSSAVLKMKQSEPIKTVPSKIVVKRKLPEKENAKNVRGAQSLFLKAIKEAGRMTRTASQIAGYGGGALPTKKDGAKLRLSVEEGKSNEEQEEAIQIDDDIDIEDALVVTTSDRMTNQVSRLVGELGISKRNEGVTISTNSELIRSEKGERSVSSSSAKRGSKNLLVTLKKGDVGNVLRTVETDDEAELLAKTRKRRNDASGLNEDQRKVKQIADETVVIKPKKLRNSDVLVEAQTTVRNEERVVSIGDAAVHEANSPSIPGDAWDKQIPVQDDSSDDDEAQIDAVLASAHTVTVGFDEILSALSPSPALRINEVTQPSQKQSLNQSSASQANAVDSMAVALPGEKIMERCKFWPNCRLEETCIYIHPTKPCSNFPHCKFGDRCIYLHFPCKFDRNCMNPHCPYVHSSKTNAVTVPVPTSISSASTAAGTSIGAISAPLNASIACKYGGKCTNPSCTYKHPKLCRFGERCTNRNCYFRHLNMLSTSTLKSAAADKYKWKATISA